MFFVCLFYTATNNLHRAIKEVILLSPRLRKHADCSRKPSLRECTEHAAALAVHVHLLLEKLKHLHLRLLCLRIETELLGVCLQSLLVWSDEGDGVRILAVVEDSSVDVLRTFHALFVWPIPKHEIEAPGSMIEPNDSNLNN